ncbi:MAG: hypothetical protein QOI20_2706 [Acidimicrobiaceae bacterium]|jgi:hypothetical protein|nr:hypothetical protein [Acidimicrobiaceae bacterium]
MATENKQSWLSRSKKTSTVALGLVAILAGIAVAYFFKAAEFPGNKAVGGTLSVDSSLPVDFSGDPLYPTNADGTADFVSQDFDVTNNNTVPVNYSIYATCKECIPDPADTPAQAAARNDKIDQFNNLYVDIRSATPCQYQPAQDIASALAKQQADGTLCKIVYHGKLADLNPTSPKSLGSIPKDGGSASFTLKLWLKNDATREQPQAVQNIWEFDITAKTP